MARKLDERIATLEKQPQRLRTRHQRIEARQRAVLSKRERAADTRRKILVGAIVRAKVEQAIGVIKRVFAFSIHLSSSRRHDHG